MSVVSLQMETPRCLHVNCDCSMPPPPRQRRRRTHANGNALCCVIDRAVGREKMRTSLALCDVCARA
jgi:hypothetical protein